MQPVFEDADHLSRASFAALAEVVQAHTGIRLPPSKQVMVEGRLRKRLAHAGCATLDQYAALVLGMHGGEELERVIDCVTTNKTEFFREPTHFEFLQDRAIPELIRLHRGAARIKVWSAACSTGAEPFTAAMVLHDLMIQRRDFHYAILGTDISVSVLNEAKAAIYPRSMMDAIPPDKRARYVMMAKDHTRDAARITPELRKRVRFRQLNLMDEQYPVDDHVDVIFCRNVLIYFERPTQEAVVNRLASHLRPGGFLLLGHSESMAGTGARHLRQVVPTIFQAPLRTHGGTE